MKRKKNHKVIHLELNTGNTACLQPIGRDSITMKEMIPAIEAGVCEIANLPEWKITMMAHNGYAVIQVHLGNKTLVATSYAVWTRLGSDAAWRIAKSEYDKQMQADAHSISESSLKREKPLASNWITTLTQYRGRHDEITSRISIVASIVTNLALCTIDYFGNMKPKEQILGPSSSASRIAMEIRNDGENIVSCDYFRSDWENTGKYLVSCNKGAIRVLWPSSRKNTIKEMMTAKEVIVTRGVYEGREGLEILFDDHSDTPFSIVMTDSSIFGFLPGDPGDKQWKFAVWMWVDGRPQMVFSQMAYWRRGTNLPDLRPL